MGSLVRTTLKLQASDDILKRTVSHTQHCAQIFKNYSVESNLTYYGEEVTQK